MTRTTLEKLRLVVPGIIILVVFSFLLPSFPPVEDLSQFQLWLAGSFYFVVVCVMGGLYNIIGIRWLLLRDSLSLIQANIKEKLTVPFFQEDQIRGKVESLSQGRQLMHVFYRIVDNDQSLKVKAQGVYSNGLYWSTIADAVATSSVAVPVYLVLYLLNPVPHYPVVALVLSVVHLVAALYLLPKVTATHIELSNDQLEFIVQHHRPELHKMLSELASRQPPQMAVDEPAT